MIPSQYHPWIKWGAILIGLFMLFNLIGCDTGPASPLDLATRIRKGETVGIQGTQIFREGTEKLIFEGGHDKAMRVFAFSCSCGTIIFFMAIEAWTELESRFWQAFWAILFALLGAAAVTAHGRIVLDSKSKIMTEDIYILGLHISNLDYQYSEMDRIGYEIETDSDDAFSGYGLRMYFNNGKTPNRLVGGIKKSKDVPGMLGLISEMTEVKIEQQAPLPENP